MTTDNLSQESLDAPKPDAAPEIPPGYISADMLTDDQIEAAHWRDRDALIVARSQAREAKRAEKAAADAKVKAESDASSKRAKDAVDEVIKRGEQEGEEEQPAKEPGKPAFELEVPETLTASQKEVAAGYAEDVAAIATEHQIPQEEAQVILDTALDVAATIMPSGEEPNLANVEECMTVMNNRWGEQATKELVADANKAVARLGANVRAWLNTPNEFGEKIGNSPAAIYALAAYQRGYTRMDPAQAASEVARLRGLKEYQQGNKLFLDHVALLGKIAHRGKSNELPMPAKTRLVSPSGAKAELDKLRMDPSYFDRYAPNHKVVVARVNELMGQLHPEG